MGVEPTLDQEFNPGRATVLKTVQTGRLAVPVAPTVRQTSSRVRRSSTCYPRLLLNFLRFGCKLGCKSKMSTVMGESQELSATSQRLPIQPVLPAVEQLTGTS